jgi:hypothetical protein
MDEEDSAVEQYFTQVKIHKLPKNMQPKFCIGDLVRIVFRSDDGPASYHLKDDIGLVCEVLFYECTDYGVEPREDREPFYLIEYKILPSSKVDSYRFISEENLRKVEND